MPVATPAARKTVVIAGDTAFVCDRFRAAVEDAGHHALAARSGAELLALVGEQLDALDLLVVDLRLPGASGVALVEALRAIHPSKPPIVVFSGTVANAGEVRALGALGVAGYLNEYTAVQHILPALLPHLSDGSRTPRRSLRAVLAIPVALRVANTLATAVTLNVGRGGIAIRSANPLAPGTCVRLRFRLPGSGEIVADARVVWSDECLGMGLGFTAIDDAHRDAIDTFVQHHYFSYRKA
jgi:CheY-like chemotaxis protein